MPPSELPLVSVIILNCNGKAVLEECIISVLNSNYPRTEVIIIDNGSTDESYMIAKKYEPQVKLTRSSRNLGYSAENNLGINYELAHSMKMLFDRYKFMKNDLNNT